MLIGQILTLDFKELFETYRDNGVHKSDNNKIDTVYIGSLIFRHFVCKTKKPKNTPNNIVNKIFNFKYVLSSAWTLQNSL